MTYDAYNVSADAGTTSFHFDVPAGHYRLTTTWPQSRGLSVAIRFGKTTRLNISVSCGPYLT
jgi:hypothetical protein